MDPSRGYGLRVKVTSVLVLFDTHFGLAPCNSHGSLTVGSGGTGEASLGVAVETASMWGWGVAAVRSAGAGLVVLEAVAARKPGSASGTVESRSPGLAREQPPRATTESRMVSSFLIQTRLEMRRSSSAIFWVLWRQLSQCGEVSGGMVGS